MGERLSPLRTRKRNPLLTENSVPVPQACFLSSLIKSTQWFKKRRMMKMWKVYKQTDRLCTTNFRKEDSFASAFSSDDLKEKSLKKMCICYSGKGVGQRFVLGSTYWYNMYDFNNVWLYPWEKSPYGNFLDFFVEFAKTKSEEVKSELVWLYSSYKWCFYSFAFY